MSKHILVIDDQPEYIIVLERMLKQLGYAVTSARGGDEGFRLAKQTIPDVIVCDLLMPDVDGMQLLEAVQKDTKLQHIPFIFLTAMHHAKMQKQAESKGVTKYIVKPLNEAELANTLREILK
jgi:CheY-like chemotaxis protein